MKRALLLFVLIVPSVGAVAALPPDPSNVGGCVQVACARAIDTDGDGAPDRATTALIVGEQVAVNLLVNNTTLLWQADATTWELGGHEAEEIAEGAGVEPTLLTVAGTGSAQVEPRTGTEASFEVYETDHETGIDETLAWAYLFLALP